MRMRVSPASIPAGTYLARFLGIEPIVSDDYGPGFRWLWEIASGPLKGQLIARGTGRKPTARNACGLMLRSVTGTDLVVGQEFDLDELVGRLFTVVVVATATGGTRVQDVLAASSDGEDSSAAPTTVAV